MKFGQQLEEQSVPEWSIHNVDYNSLKHQIKTHTTKAHHAATAITIPGQQDLALQKFEEYFYLELSRQHDRVCLFVSSKCDEIHWRLRTYFTFISTLYLRVTALLFVTCYYTQCHYTHCADPEKTNST